MLLKETKEITNIKVTGDNYTITDIVLNSVAQGLEEVVVTVDARRNTESSVLEFKENQQVYLTVSQHRHLEKFALTILRVLLKMFPAYLFKEENLFTSEA